MSDPIRREQSVWAAPDSLHFYQTHRNQPDDLYSSERFFLPGLLGTIDSVLDVGCAAGGFSQIMRAFNPGLRYVGVDVIPEFIDMAKRDFSDCEFYCSDGIDLPGQPGSFDLVHCSGVLHVNSLYREMLRSMWAHTKHYVLCDFRLTYGPAVVGEIEVNFGGGAAPGAVLPYYVLNVDELLAFLQSLLPQPGAIRAKGYPHAISPTARVPLEKVIMAFFLLEKCEARQPRVELAFDV